ncbi:MAG: hypothetical protein M9952_11400 [Microthrixaceae bacterium]|nr:hypothetical protein [Microthrixaceae bacterium]MCO5313524.1 hypothetical protein [Microthrixaceae bacterium]
MIATAIDNTTAWVSVGISWAVTVGVIGGYALMVIRKGRHLSKRVPEDERRWM